MPCKRDFFDDVFIKSGQNCLQTDFPVLYRAVPFSAQKTDLPIFERIFHQHGIVVFWISGYFFAQPVGFVKRFMFVF